MAKRFIDSAGHEILFRYDRAKGNVWNRGRRYFGEFQHADGSPACDGDFKEVDHTAPSRSIDGKFEARFIDGKVVLANKVSGEEIPEDEPLFLLRGRDALALDVLRQYDLVARDNGCNDLHLAGIQQVIRKFAAFKVEHPERMKQPGVTRHLKLEEPTNGD